MIKIIFLLLFSLTITLNDAHSWQKKEEYNSFFNKKVDYYNLDKQPRLGFVINSDKNIYKNKVPSFSNYQWLLKFTSAGKLNNSLDEIDTGAKIITAFGISERFIINIGFGWGMNLQKQYKERINRKYLMQPFKMTSIGAEIIILKGVSMSIEYNFKIQKEEYVIIPRTEKAISKIKDYKYETGEIDVSHIAMTTIKFVF